MKRWISTCNSTRRIIYTIVGGTEIFCELKKFPWTFHSFKHYLIFNTVVAEVNFLNEPWRVSDLFEFAKLFESWDAYVRRTLLTFYLLRKRVWNGVEESVESGKLNSFACVEWRKSFLKRSYNVAGNCDNKGTRARKKANSLVSFIANDDPLYINAPHTWANGWYNFEKI